MIVTQIWEGRSANKEEVARYKNVLWIVELYSCFPSMVPQGGGDSAVGFVLLLLNADLAVTTKSEVVASEKQTIHLFSQ